MERGQKRQKSLRSRFKYSFNGIQGHVPIEIWIRHILLVTDLQSLSNMAQTSKPFKEIVHENVRINNWELARRYRKEGQIPLALKCLKSCVEHNHPEATFHLGYAYIKGGWGVGTYDCELSKEYFNRALELGYERALVYLTDIQKFDPVAFNITDSFALGYFCFCHQDNYLTKAFQYFQDSAQKGDEFGQYYLGYMYFHELGTERNTFKAVEWFTRSAEQGHCVAQKALANIKRDPKWLLKTKRQKTLW
jgi:TPR repeat protein